jgi:hypothetical protein
MKYAKTIKQIKDAVKENQLVCNKSNGYFVSYNRDIGEFYITCRHNNYTIGLSHFDKKQKKEVINMGNLSDFWCIYTLSESWEKRIEKNLVGRKIVKVEYCTEDLADEQDWSSRPLQILLDNGTWLTPTSDDEGNDGGAIHTNIKELPIIPII